MDRHLLRIVNAERWRRFWTLGLIFALVVWSVAVLAAQTFVPTNITPIRCTVTVSTATTIQAVGGSCVAPGADRSIYVTDVKFDSSASAIGADAFGTLKYGTGGTCGTGTTVFWGALSAAANQTSQQFQTPIKIPANNELCWINTTAGSKFIVISGFIAS